MKRSVTIGIIFTILLIVISSLTVYAPWSNTGLNSTFRKNFTYTNGLGGSLPDFPLYFNFSSQNLSAASKVNENCSDITIADDFNGQYAIEIPKTTCNASTTQIWASANISANTIWTGNTSVYYNQSLIVGSNNLVVWKNATAVYHFDDYNESRGNYTLSKAATGLSGAGSVILANTGECKFGRCMNLTGANLSSSAFRLNTTTSTVILRFKVPVDMAGNNDIVLNSRGACDFNENPITVGFWMLAQSTEKQILYSYDGGKSQYPCGTNKLELGAWTSLIITQNGTNSTCWVNGTWSNSSIIGATNRTTFESGVVFGNSCTGWSGYQNAIDSIDEFWLYNYTWESQAIRAWYNNSAITSFLAEETQPGSAAITWANSTYNLRRNLTVTNGLAQSYPWPFYINLSRVTLGSQFKLSNCSDIVVADNVNGHYAEDLRNCNNTGSAVWAAPNISANSNWSGNPAIYYNSTIPVDFRPNDVWKNFTLAYLGADLNSSKGPNPTTQVTTDGANITFNPGDDGLCKFGRCANFTLNSGAVGGNMSFSVFSNTSTFTLLTRFTAKTSDANLVFFSSGSCDFQDINGLLIWKTTGGLLVSFDGGKTQTTCGPGTVPINQPIELGLTMSSGGVTCVYNGTNSTQLQNTSWSGMPAFHVNRGGECDACQGVNNGCGGWQGYKGGIGVLDVLAISNESMGLDHIRNFFNITTGITYYNEEGINDGAGGVGNTNPSINSVSVRPTSITVNSTSGIGCKLNASDVDANNLSITISWFNSTSTGMVNVSTLASNYTLNTLLYNSTNVTIGNITPVFHKGSGWACGVYVTDGAGGTAGPTNSSNVSVSNLRPFLMGTPTIVPSSPQPSDRLNCTVQAGDLDNASVQVNFTWFRNGVYDSSFDSQTACTNASTCYASALAFPVNKNQQWICSAVAYDGIEGSGPANSSTATVGNSIPNTPFLRTPTNTSYANFTTLLISNTTDPDGDNLSFTFFADSTNPPTTNIGNVTVLNGTMLVGNISFTNFTEGLKIFWRVNTSDGQNSSNYSGIYEFTINSLPKNRSTSITPSPAFTANNLNCSANITDVNNASFIVNWTWFRNQVLNQSAVTTTCNNNTLCFNPVLINESLVSKGDNWTCSYIVDDAIMTNNATNMTINISDSPPRTASTATVPATYANTTAILNCTTLYTDNDLDSGTVIFSWLKNGTLIDFNGTILAVSNGTTIGTNFTIPAANTSKYDNWTCQASATSTNQISNFTNSTVQIQNSKPVFNVNKTVPIELTANLFHSLHVNVTDQDSDSIISCLFNATKPDGVRIVNTSTHHLNGSNGTKYDTDLWNSTLSFNATLGGQYNFSVECNDGENNTVAFWTQNLVNNALTIVNYSLNSTFYYDTGYFTINFTTDGGSINTARVNLTGPTKNVTLTPNLASSGTGFYIYNTSYDWNQSGTWAFTIWANNSFGNQTQRSGSFAVSDVVSYSPINLSQTVDPRNQTVQLNVSIWHDSNQRFTFNLSLEMENLSSKNYGQFNHSFQFTNLSAGGNGNLTNPANRSEFRLQANDTIANGLYTGNITIFRILDNRTTKIPILLGINPPAGRIDAVNDTGQLCDSSQNCKLQTSLQTGGSTSKIFTFNNTGNFTLTNCTISFTNDLATVNWISPENSTPFSISIGSSINRRIEVANVQNVGTFLGYVDVACQATALGFVDRLAKNPSNQPIINVVVTAAPTGQSGGAGAGAGPEPALAAPPKNLTKEELLEKLGPICGNAVCDGSESPLSCAQDCRVNLDTLFCLKGEECAWKQAYFGKVVFGATLLSILVIAFKPVIG